MTRTETFAKLIRLSSIEGITAKRGERTGNPNEYWLINPDCRNGALARIKFLPNGKIGCTCRGVYVEDCNLTKIADLIAGKTPRDLGRCGFARLENRSNRPF